jgi:hypothetical protein
MSVTNEINIQLSNHQFDPSKHRPPKYDLFGRLVNQFYIIIHIYFRKKFP